MQIEAIQTFLTVVRLGSLSRAAEQMNVTQSTIAGRLDSLETALRQRLVNRSKKGATSTAAGRVFLRHAENIIENWQLSQQKLVLPKGKSRMFGFGCAFDLWNNLGENIYRRARQMESSTAFRVQSGTAAQLRYNLESGLVDAILIAETINQPAIHCRQLFVDELVQASSYQRDLVKWDAKYIRIGYDEHFDAAHLHHWPDDNIAHSTIEHPDWGLSQLLQDGGSAYLPMRLVAPYLESGRLFIVRSSPVFLRPCYLAWRSDRLQDFPWIEALLENPADPTP